MHKKQSVAICWFRRDLRLKDHAALYHALRSGMPVLPLFIFDTNILSRLEDKADRRVDMIHQVVGGLQEQLRTLGSDMVVAHGTPEDVFRHLLQEYHVTAVYASRDYEPAAIERDSAIAALCNAAGIECHTSKDQVIFEPQEILKDDGTPYTVYTPYSKRWLAKLNPFFLKAYPVEKYFSSLFQFRSKQLPSLQQLGFEKTDFTYEAPELPHKVIAHYDETRNFPSVDGTSHLAPHLRFGTISIRQLAAFAQKKNLVYLKELAWREFFMSILFHFPRVEQHPFKQVYAGIRWRNSEAEFDAWCKGETGYPMVDAGMRELNTTGTMHNRVRMVVASFLTKHLLINWQWGEAYFAKKLMDFDLSANNGNWQWAAGCGCDSAPYFRVFNPSEQVKKFDPDLKYIRKWVPELDSLSYPQPIVEHSFARDRALKTYKEALNNQ
ncbi:MAG: deoxyribodipyrimidine photo-lyase [Chitinophagaceae bacterium]